MRQVEVMRLLPAPTQPCATLGCDEVLYQELVVLASLGFAEGEGERGETEHVWRGRLTARGVEELAARERRERCDG